MEPVLYLVSTPIGNWEDITLRALNILKNADFIICEEFKEGSKLLNHYGIEKELFSLNEHNERESSEEILSAVKGGKSAALISDCGTPLFSDPGNLLVQLCISNGIKVVPIPGASSLMPALIGSGMNIQKFFYYGWLSPKKEIRLKELKRLRDTREVLVFLDTPYRLNQLLGDVVAALGKNRNICIAFELTGEKEEFIRGEAGEIFKLLSQKKIKGEFVLMVDNRKIPAGKDA